MPALGALVVTPNGVPESDRITAAFGSYRNLGRSATKAEIQAEIAAFIQGVVVGQESAAISATADTQKRAIVPPGISA